MKSKLKAAVTGTGGFLGGRIVRDLEKAGWLVYALTSQPPAIRPKNKNICPVRWDWKNKNAWPDILKRVDLCVHAAASVDFKNQNLHDLYQGNLFLTASLAEFLAKKSKARMIYLSSVSVYASNQKITLKNQPIPDTHYGISKLLGENACLDALKNRCAVLRLPGIWGKENNPKLFINRLLNQAAQNRDLTIQGAGTGKRNYLWVGDLTEILLYAYQMKWRGIRMAGAREILSIREMAEMIALQNNVKLNLAPSAAQEVDSLVEVSQDLPPQTSFSMAVIREHVSWNVLEGR